MHKSEQKILVVDDEEDICKLIQNILQDEGYSVEYATTMESALKIFKETIFNLCILDVWLHDSADDGIELMSQCLKTRPSTSIIMMSGHSTVETAVQAIKKGAYDFIEKPFKTDRLLVMVQRAIEFHRLKSENKTLKGKGTEEKEIALLGDSSVFKSFKSTLLKAAKSNNTVLIYGDSGAGKKTVARFIHQNSERKKHPCLTLQCAHGAAEELDAQLFGTENTIGLLERAHNGTLILNSISNLPLSVQKKLLRYLEHGAHKKKSDLRLIGTYDIDILEAIEKKLFLKDFFYMLNVIPIKIPLLKERGEDIPLLINYFYKELSGGSYDISQKFTESAFSVLKKYTWPGNIKQLKNFVEWLNIIGLEKKEMIDIYNLPPYLSEEDHSSFHLQNNNFLEECLVFSLKDAREKFEKNYLEGQLIRFDYNISKASHFIGMERSALHRKLKSLGVHAPVKLKDDI